MAESNWSEKEIASLRAHWDEVDADGKKLSTIAIGRMMGKSKNSIIGKAHRLDLPDRPSPIVRGVGRPPGRISRPRAPRVTLAPLAPPPAQIVLPAPPPPPPPPRRTKCCWPLGQPGTSSFRFCDDPAEPKKPYCFDHCKLAYVRLRDLEDAGARA